MRTVILLMMAGGIGAAGQSRDLAHREMQRFSPFVGKWRAEQTVRISPEAAPQVLLLDAHIYFTADGGVLVVDETGVDGAYRFIGFHAFDRANGKYLNWGAASTRPGPSVPQEGAFDASGQVITYVRPPEVAALGVLVGRGVWRIHSPDQHEYTFYARTSAGQEWPRTRYIYRRVP